MKLKSQLWTFLLTALIATTAGGDGPPGSTTPVLRASYNAHATVESNVAFDPGNALTLEALVYRTGSIVGSPPLVVRYYETTDVVYRLGLSERPDGEWVSVEYTEGALPCCGRAEVQLEIPWRTWTHIAAVLDGSTARLYVGGAEVASSAMAGMPLPQANMSSLQVGAGS